MDVRLKQYSGPFELLLTLIDDQKLNITDVSLSQVTEQFLQHLDTLEENRAEELADFLVVAARLLLLKSRALLPQFFPEEDEGQSLEEQLRLYQMFIAAAGEINNRWNQHAYSYPRIEPPHFPEHPIRPNNFTLTALHESMTALVRRLTPPKPLPETSIDKKMSVKERIDMIRKLLHSSRALHFSKLLGDAENRTEVIVSLMALLELVKQKVIVLRQDRAFTDIAIERV